MLIFILSCLHGDMWFVTLPADSWPWEWTRIWLLLWLMRLLFDMMRWYIWHWVGLVWITKDTWCIIRKPLVVWSTIIPIVICCLVLLCWILTFLLQIWFLFSFWVALLWFWSIQFFILVASYFLFGLCFSLRFFILTRWRWSFTRIIPLLVAVTLKIFIPKFSFCSPSACVLVLVGTTFRIFSLIFLTPCVLLFSIFCLFFCCFTWLIS